MLYGFREREVLMDIFEAITGLRMNHAYIRIGGVIMDLPEEGIREDPRSSSRTMPERIDEYETLLDDNPIWLERNVGVGVLPAEDALALGVTGPDAARRRASPRDLRKDEPYCGYETYDFDVPTRTEADAYARYLVRLEEMRESHADRRAVPRAPRGARSGDGRGPEGRLAGASSRSVPTASATTRRTCATSWRSRWRP